MRLFLGAVPCIGFLFAGLLAGAQPPAVVDEAILGKWDIVGMVYHAKDQDFGAPTGGTITIETSRLLLDDSVSSEFALAVRPDKKPRELTVTLSKSNRPVPGIYELKDGTLRIVWRGLGTGMPTHFDAKKDPTLTLYVLKKTAK